MKKTTMEATPISGMRMRCTEDEKKVAPVMKKSYRKQERVQKSPRKIQRADIPLSLEFAVYLHKQDGFIACTKGRICRLNLADIVY